MISTSVFVMTTGGEAVSGVRSYTVSCSMTQKLFILAGTLVSQCRHAAERGNLINIFVRCNGIYIYIYLYFGVLLEVVIVGISLLSLNSPWDCSVWNGMYVGIVRQRVAICCETIVFTCARFPAQCRHHRRSFDAMASPPMASPPILYDRDK